MQIRNGLSRTPIFLSFCLKAFGWDSSTELGVRLIVPFMIPSSPDTEVNRYRTFQIITSSQCIGWGGGAVKGSTKFAPSMLGGVGGLLRLGEASRHRSGSVSGPASAQGVQLGCHQSWGGAWLERSCFIVIFPEGMQGGVGSHLRIRREEDTAMAYLQ